MKTKFKSDEIAHIWAHQSAPRGKSPGAVSFEGAAIYSYSTVMARHIEHGGKRAIILNDGSYSASTSKHQGRIRGAIHGLELPVFRVDRQGMGASLRLSGAELFDYYTNRAAESLKDAEAPRIRPATVEGHKAKAASFLEQAKAVSEFFGLRRKVDENTIARLAASKAAAEKRERIAREKRETLERLAQEGAYAAWKAGEPIPEGVYLNARLFPVAFRIEGDELVSTLGARVPLRAAQVAYRFAMSKRGQAWRENGETCQVGHYRMNAINEQGIVAGCHRITWAEMERLAPMLSVEQPAIA